MGLARKVLRFSELETEADATFSIHTCADFVLTLLALFYILSFALRLNRQFNQDKHHCLISQTWVPRPQK